MLCLQVGMGWFPEQPGGLNRVVHALCHHLPEVGVEVLAAVTGSGQAGSDLQGRIQAFASPSAPLPLRLYRARQAIRAMLERSRPDLIATHFALYSWPALDLMARRPVVVHFHGPWADESRVSGASTLKARGMYEIERMVYRRARLAIVLSRSFGHVLEQAYGVPWERIRIVPGGVEVDRFAIELDRSDARERLGLPVKRPTVLTVRRLQRRMGLEGLLNAIAIIRRQIPDILLIVAGNGPLHKRLFDQIGTLGLEDHVTLLGRVPEDMLPLLYRAADLSVVPSLALEGFGLACPESLAAGTPVLVTPVGGLPEVVADLDPGLVMPGCRSEEVADALSAALLGKLKLPSADACRSYACSRFDWASIATKIRMVYFEAANSET